MVWRENIDSGYPNFQLDTRPSGSRGDLDYLLIRRTLSGRGSSARGDDAVEPQQHKNERCRHPGPTDKRGRLGVTQTKRPLPRHFQLPLPTTEAMARRKYNGLCDGAVPCVARAASGLAGRSLVSCQFTGPI
jgi:hypothetical protein